MAKRFTDTNKYKKPFLRGLQGPYKLLWDFLYHECDHAGMWIVDFTVAQIYLGEDMPVNPVEALQFFNADPQDLKVVVLDGGKKWFIPSFIEFQYGILNEKNRVHASVISILEKYMLWDSDKKKPLTSPLQGAKYKDKDKEQDKDAGGEGGGKFVPPTIDDVISYFIENGYRKDVAEKAFQGYDVAKWKDSAGKKIHNWKQKMVHVWFKPENKIKPGDGHKQTPEHKDDQPITAFK